MKNVPFFLWNRKGLFSFPWIVHVSWPFPFSWNIICPNPFTSLFICSNQAINKLEQSKTFTCNMIASKQDFTISDKSKFIKNTVQSCTCITASNFCNEDKIHLISAHNPREWSRRIKSCAMIMDTWAGKIGLSCWLRIACHILPISSHLDQFFFAKMARSWPDSIFFSFFFGGGWGQLWTPLTSFLVQFNS